MTSSTSKYTVTEYGKQNMFAAEAQPWIDQNDNYEGYALNAEKTNGRWAIAEQTNGRLAMIGFFAAVHNYILTGYVIPGIW